ncbi:hypothetical protein GQX74_013359 [Glossina fuscipes]|nr:hypothetical protein GQX74_013359 [Glossina fuscipes]
MKKEFLINYRMFVRSREMTLWSICSKNGLVKAVRHDNKSGCYFVDFATVVDAETVCQSLENNTLGFQVIVGKKKKTASAPIPPDLATQSTQQENRTCLSSEKLSPHLYAGAQQALDRNFQNGFIFNDDIHTFDPKNKEIEIETELQQLRIVQHEHLSSSKGRGETARVNGDAQATFYPFVALLKNEKKYLQNREKRTIITFALDYFMRPDSNLKKLSLFENFDA